MVSVFMFVLNNYAMQKDRFTVVVRNNYGAQIEVMYTLQGKQQIMVVNVDKDHFLGSSDLLSGNVKIYRAGALVGHLAAGYEMPVAALDQIWAQQKHELADALLLIVTSAPGRLVIQYHPTNKETLVMKDRMEQLQGDVMDQFRGLQKYGLEKKLTPDRILAIQSWKEEVIPGGWVVGRATTGEDIARYILELPIGYNADAVQDQFKKLSLKWHPDRQEMPYLKELGQKVMPLIIHARNLLQEALRDKGQLQ